MTDLIPQPAAGLQPVPAVGIVCFRNDQVLLIRRGQPPRQGEWSLPGGRIEPGEAVRAAALRELQEETGVSAKLLGLVDVVDAIVTNRAGNLVTRHYVLMDYAAEWVAGEVRAGSDAEEARYFLQDELNNLSLWSETRRIIEAARAHRQATL